MDKDEVLGAVKAAEEAFPKWAATPPKVSDRSVVRVASSPDASLTLSE